MVDRDDDHIAGGGPAARTTRHRHVETADGFAQAADGFGPGNGNGLAHADGVTSSNGFTLGNGWTVGHGLAQPGNDAVHTGNGSTSRNGNGISHSNGNGHSSGVGLTYPNGNGHSSGNGNGSAYGSGSAHTNGLGRSNGSTYADDIDTPFDEIGWRPVDPSRRLADDARYLDRSTRDSRRAPDAPAPFHRVYNGSPKYRGPSHWEPQYSPTLYHFSRVQAHEFGGPRTMWLALLAIVGGALAVLMLATVPSLLNRGGGEPAASSSNAVAESQFDLMLVMPTATPTLVHRPTPTPSPTPAASFQQYTVQQGDTVTRISNKFGLKTWELLAANPGLAANPKLLIVGTTINIPQHGQMTPLPS